MAPIDRNEISLLEDAKAGFNALTQQAAAVFAGLLVMLLLTRGAPSGVVIASSVCVGTAFVAWSEQKRITNLRAKHVDNASEVSRDNDHRDAPTPEEVGQKFSQPLTEQNGLLLEQMARIEKLSQLRHALAFEISPSVRFQLEEQIQREEEALASLESRLQTLSGNADSPSLSDIL